ncbi:hypothetical protein C8R47DRAFT_1215649 [Mycena vitilis]|nr:hypothetical protein C8R47DRAFT_1229793 [Mycena vitilis]KAJ6489299.1 hypothetical protein C8R47DRAFT_1215649 [Mycena vitilis]
MSLRHPIVNPDFGYLNSQIPDKKAFTAHFGAPAGGQTQLELQELSQARPAPSIQFKFQILEVLEDVKPTAKEVIEAAKEVKPVVKIEKENIPASVSHLETGRPPTKRVRLDTEAKYPGAATKTAGDFNRRINELETELDFLRHKIHDNQAAAERAVNNLRIEWEQKFRASIGLQMRLDGLRVRVHRVGGHVDQIVEHLPNHYGWKSDIGSDFDPDTTMAEFEDNTQPEDLDAWFLERQKRGLGVEEENNSDV